MSRLKHCVLAVVVLCFGMDSGARGWGQTNNGRAEPIRAIAYNVFECVGWPKNRPQAIDTVASGKMAQRLVDELSRYRPDIVTFSESPDEELTRQIAQLMGMHHVRFPSGGKWPGTLLTRFEVVESANVPMLEGERPADLFTRHWGRATVRLPDGELLIVHSAHLMPGPDSAVRLREIGEMLRSMQADMQAGRSLLVMGDLNHGPDTPEYQAWQAAGWTDTFATAGRGAGFTFRSDIPRIRIDYIMAYGPVAQRITSSRPLHEGLFRLRIVDKQSFALSDHVPQFATFSVVSQICTCGVPRK